MLADLFRIHVSIPELMLRGTLVYWLLFLIFRFILRRDVGAVGIVGAMLGGWLIGPMVGAPSINSGELSVPSLLVSFLGAVVLLAIVNLISRNRVR